MLHVCRVVVSKNGRLLLHPDKKRENWPTGAEFKLNKFTNYGNNAGLKLKVKSLPMLNLVECYTQILICYIDERMRLETCKLAALGWTSI